MPTKDPPPRTRNTFPALALVVVWSFFAILCYMMATSEDFTRNARIGFYFGGAVCGLFAVLGLGKWTLELVGVFDGTPDSDTRKPNGIADDDMLGLEEEVDGSRELRSDPGGDLLEIRDHTDAAGEQDHDEARVDRDEDREEFGLVFLSVMKVLENLPAIMLLGLGIPLLVWLLWDSLLTPTVLLGFAGCVAIYLIVRRIRRYRRRECPGCSMPMELLSEDDEDAYLSKSEILEEKLKSANYDVWMCTSCRRTQTVRYGAFFSRYSKCPDCGARTRSVSTSVISQPTNVMSGMKEITESCDNCDYTKQYRRSLPRTGS